MRAYREAAIHILNMFEHTLKRHNIYIPDDCREGNEDEACLYGNTYHELEDVITCFLESSFYY